MKIVCFYSLEWEKEYIQDKLRDYSTQDYPVKRIQESLEKLYQKTKKVPVAKQLTYLLKTFNENWDKGLWEYLHDGLKLYAFESAKLRMPKKTKNPTTYLKEQAKFINDSFGGQNWDVLMVSNKQQQMLRWFLLSPDWTISTIRQALAPTGAGAMYKESANIRRKAGAMFWLKAGLYYGVGMNMLNYYFRSEDEKENPDIYPKNMKFWDYTMFNNTLGHKTHLFTGRYDDGSERYMRWGKQFREFPELIMDDEGIHFPKPMLKKIGGKAAPQLQLGIQLFTGKTLSGYENWDLRDKKGWDWTLGAIKTIIKSPLPYSSTNLLREDKEWYPSDLAFPSSKGLTKSKAIKLYKKAIIQGDKSYVEEVYHMAIRNNIDAYRMFKVALQNVKAENTTELKSGLKTEKDILDKIKKTKNSIEIDKLKRYYKKILTEKENIKKSNELLGKVLEDLENYELRDESTKKSKSERIEGEL